MPASGSQNTAPAGGAARSNSARALHVVLLVVVGAMWGVQPALIKFSIGGSLGELEALALVLTAVAVSMGAYLWTQDRLVFPSRPILAFSFVTGLSEYAFPLLVQFLVAAHIDAGLLSLIVATTPVFTIAFAAAAGTEPLRREVVAACVVGIIAMGLIVVPENALPSREMLPWCLAAFMVPVSYSIGTIYVSRNWPGGFDSIQVGFLGALSAAVMLSPFSVQALFASTIADQTPFAWLMLLALVLSLFFELMMYFYLVRHAGPVFTSFSSFVMIVSGFLSGMVIFGERPSSWVWASVALFVISLALVFLPSRGKSIPAPESA